MLERFQVWHQAKHDSLFFGFVTGFRDLVQDLPDIHLLVIRMELVPFIDQSGVYALESSIEELHDAKVVVAISGMNKEASDMLHKMKVVPQLVPERLIFENFHECSKWLQEVMGREGSLEEELELLED